MFRISQAREDLKLTDENGLKKFEELFNNRLMDNNSLKRLYYEPSKHLKKMFQSGLFYLKVTTKTAAHLKISLKSLSWDFCEDGDGQAVVNIIANMTNTYLCL